LGTGLVGAVLEPYASAIMAINDSGLPVLALDLPSGLCADTGQVLGVAVRAEVTLSFIGLKLGLLTGEGPDYTGLLMLDDLHVDSAVLARVEPLVQRLAEGQTLPRLPPRHPLSHKGEFGHLLITGGDLGTGGAAMIAAEAGLRGGAGMVTLATRPEHLGAALVRCPEVLCAGLESSYALEPLVARASVVVVGPGLGQAPWGRSLLSLIARQPVQQVWDADALNLLASGAAWIPAGTIITPHPGEAARLLDCSIPEVQSNRPAAARLLAQRYDCIAILKGAGTLIATPEGQLRLCDRGHPAMATAGLGDVLAGLLGALLAQGLSPFDAACLGVWVHAVAGEHAGHAGRGLAATDLIPLIRQVLEAWSPCRS
jgi:ADP-dependent NAD(P)H-hydrate dehydratase / NAD(P)H-hydrate epimerase